MVKLGFYRVKKRYKNNIYVHEEVCLRFPKELHEFLRCLRYRQYEIKAAKQGNTVFITLVEKQT